MTASPLTHRAKRQRAVTRNRAPLWLGPSGPGGCPTVEARRVVVGRRPMAEIRIPVAPLHEGQVPLATGTTQPPSRRGRPEKARLGPRMDLSRIGNVGLVDGDASWEQHGLMHCGLLSPPASVRQAGAAHARPPRGLLAPSRPGRRATPAIGPKSWHPTCRDDERHLSAARIPC